MQVGTPALSPEARAGEMLDGDGSHRRDTPAASMCCYSDDSRLGTGTARSSDGMTASGPANRPSTAKGEAYRSEPMLTESDGDRCHLL
jgi:hypothetical protein